MTQITNASTYPASAVVMIQSIFPDTPAGYVEEGTGAMVGADQVLTAGHCLYNYALGGWATQVTVYAGTTSNSSNGYLYSTSGTYMQVEPSYFNDSEYYWQNGQLDGHLPGDGDIGLLTLSTPIGNQTGAFNLGYNDGDSFAGENLNTIGYPAVGNSNAWDNGYNMWSQYGTIGGTLPGSYEGTTYWVGGSPYSSFYYSQSNIYEEGGQSGSPVFAYYNNGQPSVIYGVMDVANSTTGYAERITSSVYNDLESWMANDGTDSGLRKVKTLNPPSEPPAPAPAPTPANSQTILSNSAAAAIYGQPLTFTVTVSGSGSVPTGTVTFLDGGTVLGTAKLNRNPIGVADATFTTSTLGAGSHAITAVYSGDSGFNGSFSETVTETVTETAASPVYPVFTLDSNGSLWQDGATGWTMLSPAGTILSVSATDSTGGSVAYAITADHHLWEYSAAGWSLLSSGSFQQISAASNWAGSGSVVFAVLTDHSLWEHYSLFAGGWAMLSPAGTILSVSAVTDSSGNDAEAYVITSDQHLWEHTPSGWTFLSAGSFQQVSAGLNGAGQAVVYAVLTDASLWEYNPAFSGGWQELSGAGTILSVTAGGADEVFAITADTHLWEHTTGGWALLSAGSFTSISLSATASGQSAVFAALTDTSFWEYTGGSWQNLLGGGVVATAAAL